MTAYYNPNAPKKSTNLSINSDLIQQAKLLKINLSKLLEEKLAIIIATQKEELWLQENKEAIEDYNKHISQKGLFSDRLRRF
ncbi:MAG TPA: type II toxin-antitoxin system CcdA family antitoxin [Sulfuricurvum sp.]|nr:MAG: acetoacetyl-CoA synthase [Campylobacterales bacterium 16-40-21]OZA04303.1 MAG: acetoacetyl-CoA synthase [Sulfuricurvum sp. 17-40-25]HQS66320.1 type II toxin-antitoxin system CcdA family antitoxin [Sulfuricurvum sp.]HQT35739.1 type II toxin-antitoxin system CcdA family antitoxin [Sulfuricurvum sp.]